MSILVDILAVIGVLYLMVTAAVVALAIREWRKDARLNRVMAAFEEALSDERERNLWTP
jgi:hypothetical protein